MTTRTTVVADGSTRDFAVPFPYISTTHVFVELDGVPTASSGYTWTAPGNIQFPTDLAAGVVVYIYRKTPSDPLVEFTTGSVLPVQDLDVDSRQALYRVEEMEAEKISLPALVVPGAPVVFTQAADGTVEAGSWEMAGDLTLRPNLAAGTDNLFQQLGTGAVLRGFLNKLRERVTPEDFGAVGDGTDRPVSQWLTGGALDRGYANLAAIQVAYPHVTALTDSIDWAGFQAAVNYCKTRSACIHATGQYAHNKKLSVDKPVSIIGDHWGESSTAANASAGNAKGAKITATASMTSIVEFYAGANTYLRGGVFTGFLLNAAGLAQKCFYTAGASKCIFVGLYGFAATTYGFDFSDDGNRGCFDNKIDQISYNWNNNAAADTSIGFIFRDAMQGGCVQNEVGRVYTSTNNGDGIVIGGCDNNNFYSIGGFVSGTAMGIRFSNGIGTPPLRARNNQVHYAAGKVYFESATYGNRIHRMSSENSAVYDDSGGMNWWTMFDYNSAYTAEYAFEPSVWNDVLVVPVGALQPFGGAALVTASGTVPAWELVDGSTQGVGVSIIAPRKWGRSGDIKSITVYYAMSTSASGNVRLTLSGACVGDTQAIADTSTNNFTDPAPSTGVLRKVKFTFTTPLHYTAGELLHIALQRLGGDALDTRTGNMRIFSVGLHFTSDGPAFPAVPGWGVPDPTI